MSTNNTKQDHSNDTHASNDTVTVRTLVFAIILTIAGTVGVLEWEGKIQHTTHKEEVPLASYQVVYVPVEEDGVYQLSQKPSHQSARCESGYLFIENDNDKAMQGLLVDYKNRGIKCAPATQESGTAETE